MSKTSDTIDDICGPFADVLSRAHGTDYERIYGAFDEWLYGGEWIDDDIAELVHASVLDAGDIIMDALEIDMTEAQWLALKRAVLLFVAYLDNNTDLFVTAGGAELGDLTPFTIRHTF